MLKNDGYFNRLWHHKIYEGNKLKKNTLIRLTWAKYYGLHF